MSYKNEEVGSCDKSVLDINIIFYNVEFVLSVLPHLPLISIISTKNKKKNVNT